MKTFILTIIAILGITAAAAAQSAESVTVRETQQKSAFRGRLSIRFLSVVEDSRCPVNAKCVWAGNAKIKVRATIAGGASRTFEMNTGIGSKGGQLGGYTITLVDVTPRPGENYIAIAAPHRATFSVVRSRK